MPKPRIVESSPIGAQVRNQDVQQVSAMEVPFEEAIIEAAARSASAGGAPFTVVWWDEDGEFYSFVVQVSSGHVPAVWG